MGAVDGRNQRAGSENKINREGTRKELGQSSYFKRERQRRTLRKCTIWTVHWERANRKDDIK